MARGELQKAQESKQMEEDMIGYMDWLIEAEDVDEEGNKRKRDAANLGCSSGTLHRWAVCCRCRHRQEEDDEEVRLVQAQRGRRRWERSRRWSVPPWRPHPHRFCPAESDSDDDIAYLDDDSGFCASLM